MVSIKCLCVIMAFLCLQGIGGRQFRFDYEYISETSGWFKVHLIPSTWHDARLRCHLEGSVLASPLNENILSTMITLMSAKGVASSGVFTGVHSIFSKGYYASIEGVPIAKIKVRWAPGEPDNLYYSEDCLILHGNGTMADVNCKILLPFICYKKMNTKQNEVEVMNECGTFDHAYKRNSSTGSCYKFHNQPQNWSQAYATCMAEGGHLLVINSNEEAQAIKHIYEKNPEIPIIGTYQKDVILVGFHDWGVPNNWVTIHGQSLEAAGYASWAAHQPDALPCGQSCGGAFRATALFADLCCNHLYPFICEKSVDSLLTDDDK